MFFFPPCPEKEKKKHLIAGEDPLIQRKPDHLTRNLKLGGITMQRYKGKKAPKSVTFPEL